MDADILGVFIVPMGVCENEFREILSIVILKEMLFVFNLLS